MSNDSPLTKRNEVSSGLKVVGSLPVQSKTPQVCFVSANNLRGCVHLMRLAISNIVILCHVVFNKIRIFLNVITSWPIFCHIRYALLLTEFQICMKFLDMRCELFQKAGVLKRATHCLEWIPCRHEIPPPEPITSLEGICRTLQVWSKMQIT